MPGLGLDSFSICWIHYFISKLRFFVFNNFRCCAGLWSWLKLTEEQVHVCADLCRLVQLLKLPEVHKICWCSADLSDYEVCHLSDKLHSRLMQEKWHWKNQIVALGGANELRVECVMAMLDGDQSYCTFPTNSPTLMVHDQFRPTLHAFKDREMAWYVTTSLQLGPWMTHQ